MNKEKKDKPRKKKVVQKPSDTAIDEEKMDEGDPPTESSGEAPGDTVDDSPTVDRDKEQRSRERGRSTPDGFFVAHPRSMKRTTNFKDVHSRKLAELLEAFHMFDFDRDGVINGDDLKKTFVSLNWGEVEEEKINQMLSEALNPLNFDAFVILLGYKTLDFDPEEVLLDAFSNWDDRHEGLVSHERLLHHIMACGNKFTEEEAMAALADAPIVLTKTKEKMIDYVQFSEDLCGLRKLMQKKSNDKGN